VHLACFYIPLTAAAAPAGYHLTILEELYYFTMVGTGFALKTSGFVVEICHLKAFEFCLFLNLLYFFQGE
jgi:hypothetical protein